MYCKYFDLLKDTYKTFSLLSTGSIVANENPMLRFDCQCNSSSIYVYMASGTINTHRKSSITVDYSILFYCMFNIFSRAVRSDRQSTKRNGTNYQSLLTKIYD